MTDPGNGDLAKIELGKHGLPLDAGALHQQGFPNHLMKKCAWIEMLRGSEILERTGEALFGGRRAVRRRFRHNPCLLIALSWEKLNGERCGGSEAV